MTSQDKRPSAILCSNDMTIARLEAGRRTIVRDQIGVDFMDYSDIRLAQFTTPPLTTVQMSQTE